MPVGLRFVSMTLLLLVTVVSLAAGGGWMWAGFLAAVATAALADEGIGDDVAEADPRLRAVYDGLLTATLPLLAVSTLFFLHHVGTGDPFGLARLAALVGLDLDAGRAATGPWSTLGGVMTLGIMYGGAGVTVAHELVHRVHSPRDLIVGRWLLAFTLDTTFAIEHVYGHHRHVGTDRDPATARRGETVFGFFLRSTFGQIASAFRIEAERLKRKGEPVLSWRNRALRGQAMSLAVVAVAAVAAGPLGVGLFLVAAVQGKAYLEAVNFIEHYGLVRVPGSRVEPRHSWNCDRLVSNALLYNLARHSDHHARAMKPFWTLVSETDAPRLPHGYLTMIGFALVPPLFERTMAPLLAVWDRELATPEERALATAGDRPPLRPSGAGAA